MLSKDNKIDDGSIQERITVIPSPNQPNCETTPAPSCDFPPGNIIYQGQTDCFTIDCL